MMHALDRSVEADGDILTVDIRAQSARAARIMVQHRIGEALSDAGLARRAPDVVWVAPLDVSDESSHRFMEQARGLLEAEDFELAIVAAQIHLEMHVATLLRRFVEADDSPLGRALVASNTEWTASQSWQRSFLEQLLGRRVSKDFPGWKRYQAHLERRNDVVHRGQAVDQTSAEESLEVVEAFWEWLNNEALRALDL